MLPLNDAPDLYAKMAAAQPLPAKFPTLGFSQQVQGNLEAFFKVKGQQSQAYAPPTKNGKAMTLTREEIGAKIEASEARTETKITRLEGKIDLVVSAISDLSSKLDGQKSDASANRNVIIATVIGAALTVAGLFYAAISYGSASFYNGTVVRDIVHAEGNSKPPNAASTPSTGGTPAR